MKKIYIPIQTSFNDCPQKAIDFFKLERAKDIAEEASRELGRDYDETLKNNL